MGKIKRRKLRGFRYTPSIGSVNSEVTSEKYLDVSADKLTLNNNGCNSIVEISAKDVIKDKNGLKVINEKILSNYPEERVMGLNILAGLALEEQLTECIVQSKIIASVAPLLQDSCSQVRLAAAGALRNLCVSGSDDMVDLMVQQDILSPLAKLLKEYTNNTPPSDLTNLGASLTYNKGIANAMDDTDPCNLIFIHATNLLWNLCECNGEAIMMCNQEGLADVLLKHIDPLTWNYPVALAAADCLLCISENNPRTSSIILPSADSLVSLVVHCLSNHNNFANLHYAVLISGILVNLNYWTPGGASFQRIFEVLGRVLDADAYSLLSERLLNGGRITFTEDLEHVIAAQLLAFEILSNICCPDDEDWEECEEVSSEEEMVDLPTSEVENPKETQNSLPPEVIEGIKYYQLVEKTLRKIKILKEQFFTHESKNKDVNDKLQQLQIRALQCCQNLVSCLDIEDFGGVKSVYTIWLELGKMTLDNSCKEPNLLEASSGAMRAFIDKLSSQQCPQLVTITNEDLKHIFEAGATCVVPAVRANFARMVGVLGCLLIQRIGGKDICMEPTYSIFFSITDFLIKIAQDDEALWVSAEALDAIIDLYSDDKTDQLASQVSLVEKLKEIHPHFKAKHNKLRKTLGDHRPLVVTVRDNLVSFIKYKGPRTSKLSHQLNRMVL